MKKTLLLLAMLFLNPLHCMDLLEETPSEESLDLKALDLAYGSQRKKIDMSLFSGLEYHGKNDFEPICPAKELSHQLSETQIIHEPQETDYTDQEIEAEPDALDQLVHPACLDELYASTVAQAASYEEVETTQSKGLLPSGILNLKKRKREQMDDHTDDPNKEAQSKRKFYSSQR